MVLHSPLDVYKLVITSRRDTAEEFEQRNIGGLSNFLDRRTSMSRAL